MKQHVYFPGASRVSFTPLYTVDDGQDGAIFDDLLFKLDHTGRCRIYRLATGELLDSLLLDGAGTLAPHANAVVFGPRDEDAPPEELPLLYANIYNNAAAEENDRPGECLVYRLRRTETGFTSTLVQHLKVGFTHTPLWRSATVKDKRPYGNFVIDTQAKELVVFVMRDEDGRTRLFRFPLPRPTMQEGVELRVLTQEELVSHVDTDYMHYMQGACLYEGYLYSVEGFSDDEENPPVLRVIHAQSGRALLTVKLSDHGLKVEPELVEVWDGRVYYADGHGRMYAVSFLDENE